MQLNGNYGRDFLITHSILLAPSIREISLPLPIVLTRPLLKLPKLAIIKS